MTAPILETRTPAAPWRSPRRRLGGVVFLTASVLVLAAFAWVWRRDRVRTWERPRFETAGFVQLAGAPSDGGFDERWVVIVQHRCPHCREHLAQALAARARRPGLRLDALFVDTSTPPAAAAFASEGVDGMWWDARDTWRRRWGHRLYGEVLVFDRRGRYLETLPPGAPAH
jgi:hypothetical protein